MKPIICYEHWVRTITESYFDHGSVNTPVLDHNGSVRPVLIDPDSQPVRVLATGAWYGADLDDNHAREAVAEGEELLEEYLRKHT